MQKLSLGFNLFIIFIILEIMSLLIVGRYLGIWLTVLSIVWFSIMGLALLWWQSKILFKFKDLFNKSLVNSVSPVQSLSRSIRFLVAGLLFMSPGFFSNLLAIIILLFPSYLFFTIFPYHRRFSWVKSFFAEEEFSSSNFGLYKKKTHFNSKDIIECQFSEVDKEN